MLDRLHAPGRGDDDDLLPPGGPQDLLAGARGEDLLVAAARLVDDDGLLTPHGGHLHARLHLAGHHPRPDSSDLRGSSG